MIAVIMCGGKGTRFITQDNIEKPLAHIRGQTLIETVLRAVILSGQFSRILCVSSPSSPHTTQLLEEKYSTVDKIEVMVAEGLGYSSDLSQALNSMLGQKVLTFPSDLALLNVVTVRKLVDKCTPSIHDTCIAAVVAIRSKEYCYTGVCGFYLGTSISEKPFKEFYSIVNEIQLVANINTAMDLGLAEHLLVQLNQDCL
jgi:GTP:adenosylcobinamide-phosphate guanylyltransferase